MYRYDQYHNSRHSGAISLSIVCGSMVLAQGRFRRQIGTESCHRVGSYRGHIGIVSSQFRFVYILARGLSGHKVYQLQQLSGL